MGITAATEAEIEPTEEMIRAGANAMRMYPDSDYEMMAYSCFKAMLRAASEEIIAALKS